MDLKGGRTGRQGRCADCGRDTFVTAQAGVPGAPWLCNGCEIARSLAAMRGMASGFSGSKRYGAAGGRFR